MSSLIKSLFCILFLFGIHFCIAQENQDISEKNSKKAEFIHFSLGIYQPVAFGNNMASKAMRQKTGVNLSLLFRFKESPYLLGGEIQGFEATVKPEEKSQVGNYNESNVYKFGVKAGYIFWEKSDWMAYATLGLGRVIYNNESTEFNFKDTGTAVELGSTLRYNFHRNFGVYGAITYRHDFLSTKAPAEIRNFFKHQDYIFFGLGAVVSF